MRGFLSLLSPLPVFSIHHQFCLLNSIWVSLVAQRLKRLPPMWETRVQSLGQEDPLEKEMEPHSIILAWRIPWREEPGRLQSMGSQRVRYNWATSLHFQFSSVQFIPQLCPTLCNPMDYSTPGFPVHHQLPEIIQTQDHWVSDVIQPSHPLSSPFPSTFNLSQHWGLFKLISSMHQEAKVLEFQYQHESFQWVVRTDFL